MAVRSPHRASLAIILSAMLDIASTAVVRRQSAPVNPFAPIDPQNWVNPDNMTWDGMYKHWY
jgi:hypothetical protein